MTQLLKDKEWFKPVPSSSMLRREPACAWFTAGVTEIVQSSKDLPALHKDVLRQALKRWTEVYFFLPVGGITKQGKIITHNGNKHTLLHTLGYTHTIKHTSCRWPRQHHGDVCHFRVGLLHAKPAAQGPGPDGRREVTLHLYVATTTCAIQVISPGSLLMWFAQVVGWGGWPR